MRLSEQQEAAQGASSVQGATRFRRPHGHRSHLPLSALGESHAMTRVREPRQPASAPEWETQRGGSSVSPAWGRVCTGVCGHARVCKGVHGPPSAAGSSPGRERRWRPLGDQRRPAPPRTAGRLNVPENGRWCLETLCPASPASHPPTQGPGAGLRGLGFSLLLLLGLALHPKAISEFPGSSHTPRGQVGLSNFWF